ncbi:MAG: hypothetical protein QXG00_00655 [Candidatus Woesearchaeota archaeon]
MSNFTTKKEGMRELYILIISIVAIVGILTIVLFVVMLRSNITTNIGKAYYNTNSELESHKTSWGYVSGNTYYIGSSDSFILNKDGSILVIRQPGLSTLSCKCSVSHCGSQCLMTISNNKISCAGDYCQIRIFNN